MARGSLHYLFQCLFSCFGSLCCLCQFFCLRHVAANTVVSPANSADQPTSLVQPTAIL
ncbi:hypothetical protein PR003_g34002 [Phytophthora rubi]|uniref:Uncharacterized protein n=1 Tax=Phytophthora rubi TaxID=129364 RepID=A0A6A4AQT5_9STRA|nr:hypothetical protein PR001_g28768 [Phytophthora rubi]KAE9261263.1 hypothetical protein PR003_g34002 [Phytophthora rubi]